jgi:hypothetical protein
MCDKSRTYAGAALDYSGKTPQAGDRCHLEGQSFTVVVGQIVNGGAAAIVYGPDNYSGVVPLSRLTK